MICGVKRIPVGRLEALKETALQGQRTQKHFGDVLRVGVRVGFGDGTGGQLRQFARRRRTCGGMHGVEHQHAYESAQKSPVGFIRGNILDHTFQVRNDVTGELVHRRYFHEPRGKMLVDGIGSQEFQAVTIEAAASRPGGVAGNAGVDKIHDAAVL